jgi:hypothetical protein
MVFIFIFFGEKSSAWNNNNSILESHLVAKGHIPRINGSTFMKSEVEIFVLDFNVGNINHYKVSRFGDGDFKVVLALR